jgi:prepilin-type processing-associated H-X9-DG protein
MVLTYEQRVEKLKKGALFKYCNNVKAYRCPEADKDMHRTYVIPESMNARWPFHTEGIVIKKIVQIKKTAERVVFFEERRITGDTCIYPYDTNPNTVYWDGDTPNIMHGNGANFGFADGHADFHKWECETTLEMCKRPPFPLPTTAEYTTYRNRAITECGNTDAIWMENAVWGVSL